MLTKIQLHMCCVEFETAFIALPMLEYNASVVMNGNGRSASAVVECVVL